MNMNLSNSSADFSVSVVIPVYNSAASIERAINSVDQQTVPVCEVIVVDDGSSDETVDVVNQLKLRWPKIRLFQQPNGGPAKARNTGIENAKGKWIAFLDADDVWLPKRLELQQRIIDAYPQIKWASGAFTKIKFDILGNEITVGNSSMSQQLCGKPDGVFDALAEIANGSAVWTGSMLIRRDELVALGGFDERIKGSEDVELWVRLAIRNPQIGFVTTSIALYTIDQANSVVGKNARTLDTTKFLFYERLVEAAEKSNGEAKLNIEKLLSLKIQRYTSNLLRMGESESLRNFITTLKQQKLPLPNFTSQLVAFIPRRILKGIRSILVLQQRRR